MKCRPSPCRGHRFPPEIIGHAVWLYNRFSLGRRDVEDILAQRGIVVTHESIRLWCNKFGPRYANNRAELSQQPTRVRKRGMRRFKSMFQVQRLVRVHATVSNLLNLGRHVVAAGHYRTLRRSAFASWDRAAAI